MYTNMYSQCMQHRLIQRLVRISENPGTAAGFRVL